MVRLDFEDVKTIEMCIFVWGLKGGRLKTVRSFEFDYEFWTWYNKQRAVAVGSWVEEDMIKTKIAFEAQSAGRI